VLWLGVLVEELVVLKVHSSLLLLLLLYFMAA